MCVQAKSAVNADSRPSLALTPELTNKQHRLTIENLDEIRREVGAGGRAGPFHGVPVGGQGTVSSGLGNVILNGLLDYCKALSGSLINGINPPP